MLPIDTPRQRDRCVIARLLSLSNPASVLVCFERRVCTIRTRELGDPSAQVPGKKVTMHCSIALFFFFSPSPREGILGAFS